MRFSSAWVGRQSLEPRVNSCLICLNLAQQLTGSQAASVAPCGSAARIHMGCCELRPGIYFGCLLEGCL